MQRRVVGVGQLLRLQLLLLNYYVEVFVGLVWQALHAVGSEVRALVFIFLKIPLIWQIQIVLTLRMVTAKGRALNTF